jgi:hypothetical protein
VAKDREAGLATKARFVGANDGVQRRELGTMRPSNHAESRRNANALFRHWPRLAGAALACLLAGGPQAHGASPVVPEIFSPGVISAASNVNAITFAPDGSAAWFDEVAGGGSTIMESHRVGGEWTPPRIAAFSGQWRDLDPAMSPDGSFIVFCSNRPASPGGRALDMTTFDGRVRAGMGGHLWRVDRTPAGWGEPVLLPPEINDDARLFSPSVVNGGSLYYQHPDAQSRTVHLMRSQYAGGHYLRPVPVVVGPREADERDPAVAPDESFIVYSSKRPPASPDARLVIAFRTGERWGEPIDLGDGVNRDGAEGAHLGPDGRTIYIDSAATFEATWPRTREQTQRDLERARLWDNGNSHLWSFSLTPWLEGRGR